MHYWYSAKMEQVTGRGCPVVMLAGVLVRYNIATRTAKHSAHWDDVVYLGFRK